MVSLYLDKPQMSERPHRPAASHPRLTPSRSEKIRPVTVNIQWNRLTRKRLT